MVKLEAVEGDRESWIPLLMEADSSESIVRAYMDDGDLLAIREEGNDVGVALLLRDGDEVEIKNLAIVAERRGQGIGRKVIGLIADRSRAAGARSLIVGTANSSMEALRFYQLAGFRMHAIRTGFFDAYPDPIWEHGIRARDMVMFQMEL